MPNAWTVTDMGGEIPIQDPRLLADNQADEAWNTDVQSGGLDGLPVPELVIDLSAVPGTVKKAYRLPGPNPGDADVWQPLPSPYSSVVRSPLADDTLHRIYWTNPPGLGGDADGGHWNTYQRIHDGLPSYTMGFLPVESAWVVSATATGGSTPGFGATGAPVADPGAGGYAPGTVLTVTGGTLTAGTTTRTQVTIVNTQVVQGSVHIVAGGAGGTNGQQVFSGTTGTGNHFSFLGTVSGGALVAINTVTDTGFYTVNPSNLANEPITGGSVTGASVSIRMGVQGVTGLLSGRYDTPPPNPAATSDSGTGLFCTLDVVYLTEGLPEVERSYLFTYIDQYGQESSPSLPSAVVAGASDGLWTVFGISNVPPTNPNPTTTNFPTVVKVRLYRTITGATAGAQFYAVGEIAIPPGLDPLVGYVDTSLDTELVSGTVLESASWASPVSDLDGLIALPGGMLAGFSDNTVHFCEPDRPNAWPAAYDQSVQYKIVGLALWQGTLVVLTQGFPSTGQGTSPAAFVFSQVQVAEPCIARGSIITDLLGVYYASSNGLVMLNYYGMQNQTLTLISRKQWQLDFLAAELLACRHRSQYLCLNGVGVGFLIDYAEKRLGLVRLNTFNTAVSIWNDVYSSDVNLMTTAKQVYKWDSTATTPLIWRWRSKRWSQPAPLNLGACQITCDPAVENTSLATDATPGGLDNGDTRLDLPPGINAVFRLYRNDSDLVVEHVITSRRDIFRLPSGFMAFDWQFEIVSRVTIFKVELARTMKELKDV